MKAVSSHARFQGRWTVEVQVDLGSVPDRRMPYSSVGASYRPARLVLEFYTSAKHLDTYALRMENGSGFMKQAAVSAEVSSVTIYGRRLKKDGTGGQHVVDEKFYPRGIRDGSVPEWVREVIAEQLRALGVLPE